MATTKPLPEEAPAIPGSLTGDSRVTPNRDAPEESNLVAHARRELQTIGEDPWLTDGLCNVVQAFASMGHSGSSAPHAIAYLEKILQFKPLSELTDDPAEWIDRHAQGMTSSPLWQSLRDSEAMSTDGGKTYTLLSEQAAAGDMATTPLHRSKRLPKAASRG